MKKFALLFTIALSFSMFAQGQAILSLEQNAKTSISNNEAAVTPIQQPQELKKKNVGLAILYSVLLPGMGELYAGNYSTGKYFTIAEGALWGTYIGIHAYASWQKDRYESYAVSNGGVNGTGKDADFYANIGNYQGVEQYNNEKAFERDFGSMYNETTQYWKWTEEGRRTYRSMWVSSEQAYTNLRFVVGALIVNRVLSAVNAVRLVAAYNKNLQQELSWNLSVGVLNNPNMPQGMSLNFQTSL